MSFGSQQIRARHRNRADPHRAEQGRVPLRDPRQHHEHVVSLADPEIEQRPRRLARGLRQVGRGLRGDNVAAGVEREHGQGIRILRGPLLDDVEHRVEAIGDLDVVAGALGVEIDQARRTVASGTSYGSNGHWLTVRGRRGPGIRANPIVVCGELRNRGRPARG